MTHCAGNNSVRRDNNGQKQSYNHCKNNTNDISSGSGSSLPAVCVSNFLLAFEVRLEGTIYLPTANLFNT